MPEARRQAPIAAHANQRSRPSIRGVDRDWMGPAPPASVTCIEWTAARHALGFVRHARHFEIRRGRLSAIVSARPCFDRSRSRVRGSRHRHGRERQGTHRVLRGPWRSVDASACSHVTASPVYAAMRPMIAISVLCAIQSDVVAHLAAADPREELLVLALCTCRASRPRYLPRAGVALDPVLRTPAVDARDALLAVHPVRVVGRAGFPLSRHQERAAVPLVFVRHREVVEDVARVLGRALARPPTAQHFTGGSLFIAQLSLSTEWQACSTM